MNSDALFAVVQSVRKRIAEGDCPSEPAMSRELLEEAVVDLANFVGALADPETHTHPALTGKERP